MWAGLLLRAAAAAAAACLALSLPARGYPGGRKKPAPFAAERRRLGPHVCLSGFGSGCCPGWVPSLGSGQCTLPLCTFGCGSGYCIAPNVCSCRDGEQGITCPEAPGPCGEYGCDLACNHGGCQEVARVCPVGFSMIETAIGIKCTDIDECLSSSCEGLCVNTEGGFVCECGPGMQLSADRHSCQDTDECLGIPCQQSCKNSIGSYRCSCRAGFYLHGNRHSCVDVNECRRPPERRVCHHSCHNTMGSFRCACRAGFRLSADRASCEAFPKAVLAPSAILQSLQHPPKMLLLFPESGPPALPPGHGPPSRAPGPHPVTKTTPLVPLTSALPTSSTSAWSPTPSATVATPSPSSSSLGRMVKPSILAGLLPPSLLHGEAVRTPSPPRGPSTSQPLPAPSPCWHQGGTHEHGSRWTEPGCLNCGCQDGEVTCDKVTCKAACSHPLPSPDGCCPDCSGCFYGGFPRAEGDVFSPPNENCTVCICLAGNVSCIAPECPPGPCLTPPQSDCCPCVPVRCYFHGRFYPDGAEFSGDGDECTTCVCQKGEVQCSFTPCPELDCPREEWQLGPGQCCFTCREPTPVSGCSLDDNGIQFPIGQIWSPGDPYGSVSCERTDCVETCPHPIRIPGQCCPDCSAGCTYTGRIFYNNETFPSVLDPCLSCICLLGSVACSPVDCLISCTYPFHPEGECCPICHDCNYEGRKVGNGQVFWLENEPCTRCVCQLGEVSCEKVTCQPACADPGPASRDCCSSCQGVLLPVEGMLELSPPKAARSPGEAAVTPQNCSICPGAPMADAQSLQVLLRKNTSTVGTFPMEPLGPGPSRSPQQQPRAVLAPCSLSGASCLDHSTPGASHLPPTSPEVPSSLPAMAATSLPPSRVPGTLHAHSASEGLLLPIIQMTKSSGPAETRQEPSEPPTVSSMLPGSSSNTARLSSSPTVSPRSPLQKPTEKPSYEGEWNE
ncbi:von Willebrand factor C and EGF domain-containing protein isoform X2 [Monodelphis domestica]|uniref:von Willebrand factor C and EGF domain-containing protein isoform X2 n=1 Tax=Monodelphis domestica TaxID=13616 RepID=UPI0024E23813|nr:von Willebrand factor C and EGF domain-containing protein isoform X2 [Monodelphis domestica]